MKTSDLFFTPKDLFRYLRRSGLRWWLGWVIASVMLHLLNYKFGMVVAGLGTTVFAVVWWNIDGRIPLLMAIAGVLIIIFLNVFPNFVFNNSAWIDGITQAVFFLILIATVKFTFDVLFQRRKKDDASKPAGFKAAKASKAESDAIDKLLAEEDDGLLKSSNKPAARPQPQAHVPVGQAPGAPSAAAVAVPQAPTPRPADAAHSRPQLLDLRRATPIPAHPASAKAEHHPSAPDAPEPSQPHPSEPKAVHSYHKPQPAARPLPKPRLQLLGRAKATPAPEEAAPLQPHAPAQHHAAPHHAPQAQHHNPAVALTNPKAPRITDIAPPGKPLISAARPLIKIPKNSQNFTPASAREAIHQQPEKPAKPRRIQL